MIVGIDPGPEVCAVVSISDSDRFPSKGDVVFREILTVEDAIHRVQQIKHSRGSYATIVCEDVACMGMRVGREVFETCKVIGRLWQAVGPDFKMVPRPKIKHHFCPIKGANDASVRAKLIDIYGPGKAKAVGTKKARGPLHGIKSHEWQALAVARYYLETKDSK